MNFMIILKKHAAERAAVLLQKEKKKTPRNAKHNAQNLSKTLSKSLLKLFFGSRIILQVNSSYFFVSKRDRAKVNWGRSKVAFYYVPNYNY